MKKFFKENRFIILFILTIAVLRLFVITPVKVSGHSMDPTLADGQRLMALKIVNYKRGDIIICIEPDEPDKIAVKRLIGLPGDTIEMKDDVLTVNGEVVEEEYLAEFKAAFASDKLQEEYAYDESFQQYALNSTQFTNDFSVTVPSGSYFVMGDNRLISRDSRSFGVVTEEQMKGKVALRYWPINSFNIF